MAFVALPFFLANTVALGTLATEASVVTAGAICLAAHSIKLTGAIKGLFAAKATAEAVGGTATAYAATTAATATASTSTATTATATAATAATGTATATTTAAWLASLAMTPAGIVVIGAAAGCAAYYAYRKYRSWKAARNNPSETTPRNDELHSDNQHDENDGEGDTERDPPPGLDKPVLIPKKELKKLLKSKGREMYEKLKAVLTGDRQSTVWSDINYRIDPGHTMHGNPNLKTWNLQVQGEAESAVARDLKARFGTHAKLFWDVFNMENPPSFSVWMKRILSLLK